MTIDLNGLAQAIVNALLTGLTALVSTLPRQTEQWMLSSIQSILASESSNNLLTQNPVDWTSRDPDVQSLFMQGGLFAAVLAALVLCIQGYRVMAGKVEMFEAIGRTVFLVIIGISMRWIADDVIVFTNIASEAVSSDTINLTALALPSGLEVAAILIIGLLFALLAWIKGAVGVVFLKVLIVLAPYFMPLSALPIFEGLGTWWVEEFTTWTLRPFMVALAMRLGLGLGAREDGPIGLLFILVTFWLAWTMDSRIRRFSVGAWGSVGQLNLFSRAARMIAGASSGGTATAASTAAASTATP